MEMRPQARKTSPKVLGGKVQRKNRWDVTRTYWNTRQAVPVIDREEPGRGYRHVLRRKDVFAFIDVMPDWEEISQGLDAIVLAAGSDRADGWHRNGVIGLCAWERDLWRVASTAYYEEHAEFFDRLGIPCEPEGDDWTLKFTETTAAAFQLLHVLPHELGHHHDRMTTRSQRKASRGERYAEDYAVRYERRIWDSYFRVFGAV
jgi:hypothetical protein